MLDGHHDHARQAAGSPVLIELVAVARVLERGALQSGRRRLGAKGVGQKQIAMKVILLDDQRVMRVGMLVVTIGQQKDRAEISRASPEFREHIALEMNALHPLVLGNRLAETAAPVEHAVHLGELFLDGRNLLGK